MATCWSHKFNVSISVDVNDDDEYRYTPIIMRLCLGMSGVRKHAQKIVLMGFICPIGLKKSPNSTFSGPDKVLTCTIIT